MQVESVTIADQSQIKETVSSGLWKAYSLLEKIDDPVVQHTKKHIWRRIWAIENLKEWFQKLTDEPAFAKILYRAIPYDDIELLQEIKSIANNAKEASSSFVVGLINERLERSCAPAPNTQFHSISNFQSLPRAKSFETKINYQGYVCSMVEDLEGNCIAGNVELPVLTTVTPSKTHCRLAVWMQPNMPIGPWTDEVQIETGSNEDFVEFSFELDCATLPIPYGRKRSRFARSQKSNAVFFDFYTESKSAEHLMFVHVLQENRLIKSLLMVLQVSKKGVRKNAPTRYRKS